MERSTAIILGNERLILRTWEESDIDLMAAIDQDPKGYPLALKQNIDNIGIP